MKRFYAVENNIAKAEEIIHWRLRKNRVNYEHEFFKIDDLEYVDSIANEIIPIMNDDLYPKVDATEEQLRLFVIKILGGVKEDIGEQQDDSHMRFDFGGRMQYAIEHNNSIIAILKDWKLLSKTLNFEFFTAEGTPTYWFTLKPYYVLENRQEYLHQICDSHSSHEGFYDYFQGHFQYEKEEYVSNLLSEIEKRSGRHFEYRCDWDGYGTISIVVSIIKLITLSHHHKRVLEMQ